VKKNATRMCISQDHLGLTRELQKKGSSHALVGNYYGKRKQTTNPEQRVTKEINEQNCGCVCSFDTRVGGECRAT